MIKRIFSMVLIFMLLISLSVCAINFRPEETYRSVVVVYSDRGVGSGFALQENLIVTNAHVIDGNTSVKIKLYDGTTVPAFVIKSDTKKDLALLSIHSSITPLDVNESDFSVGQEVYAIGTPKDMPYTMTKGIISALDRELGGNSYIQIDASVNAGNSGGPLLDENGAAIGIITLKASDAEGIGFAIYMKDVIAFADGVDASLYPEADGGASSDGPTLEKTEGGGEESAIQTLIAENNNLKLVVCISVLLNMILILALVLVCMQKKAGKPKDEFDFEIEIEE